jgi:hypothetical protein
VPDGEAERGITIARGGEAVRALRRLPTVLLWPLCIGWAAVLYEDDFCVGNMWAEIERPYAFPEISVDNCEYRVANPGTNAAMVRHEMSLPGTFSIALHAAPVTETYDRIGILFCLDADGNGYAFSVSSRGTWRLDRYEGRTAATITGAVPSAAVKPSGANTLTVSKSGNRLSLVCNGVYLESADDGAFSGGGIGLVVSGGSAAAFRRVRVTDREDVPAERITCMWDGFTSGEPGAWQVIWSSTASWSFADGHCTLNNTSSVGAHMFQVGSYAEATLRCIVTFRGGTGMYGLGFFQYDPGRANAVTTRAFAFVVDGARRHAIVRPGGGRMSLGGPTTYIHGASGTRTDTLEVKRANGRYAFSANGHHLSDAPLPDGFAIDGAGMYAGSGAHAAFDEFRGGSESCLSVRATVPTPVDGRPEAATPLAAFTPGGRLVARLHTSDIRRRPPSAGVCVVLYTNGRGSGRYVRKLFVDPREQRGIEFPRVR